MLSFDKIRDLIFSPSLSLSLKDKIKFLLVIRGRLLQQVKELSELENVSADQWLKDLFGEKIYKIFYKYLSELNFGLKTNEVSAVCAKNKVLTLHGFLTSFHNNEFGYLEDSMHRLVHSLALAIEILNGQISYNSEVISIETNEKEIIVNTKNGKSEAFQAILSTVSPQILAQVLVNTEKDDFLMKLNEIEYINEVSYLLRLKKSFSKYFIININDKDILTTEIIEITNLKKTAAPVGEK